MSDDKHLPEIVNKNNDKAISEHDQEFESMANYQPLQPGMYWKCVKEIKDQRDYEMQVGLTYLLVSVEMVEDEAHTVKLRPHPGNKKVDPDRHKHMFLVEELMAHFEPDYDYKKVRDGEIAEIQQRIQNIQKVLSDRQSNPSLLIPEVTEENEDIDFSLGLPDPNMNKETGVNELIAKGEEKSLEVIRKQAENQRALAEAQANWIGKQTSLLSETVSELAPYYSEQAAASLAACSDAVEHAENIVQAVKTMGLYVGKNVEVVKIAEGKGADPSEPLHLFQRKLYMDEELLINVADGGADASSFEEFCEAIRTDDNLLERLLPVPRGIVTMQFRRKDKKYSDNAWVNAQMNAENRVSFLLVRNGENVYQVYSELATADTPRLFPTTDDMDRPFKGIDGEKIKFKDVRFTGSLKWHDNIALHYKRLLITLFGLHDRERLFGDFAAEADGPLNFLDEATQHRIFKFIHDAEGNLIGENRPTWNEYLKEKNALLQSGSRVIAIWELIMNTETCPTNCKYDHNSYRGWWAKRDVLEDWGFRIVAREKENLFVKCPVGGNTMTWTAVNDRVEHNVKVYLNKYKPWGDNRMGFLVLDDVKSADIDFYLNDRRSREDYLNYLEIMLIAREMLQKDEKHEAPMREKVVESLLEGGIINEGDNVFLEIDNAVRSWRAANRGKELPLPGEKNFKVVLNKLLDNLYVLVGAGRDRLKFAEEMAAAEGRTPLRLVITGRNRLALYTAPLDSEKVEIDMRHVWVHRTIIEERKTKFSPGNRKAMLLPDNEPSETVLHEWGEVKDWSSLKEDGEVSLASINAATSACKAGVEHLAKIYNKGYDSGECLDLMEQFEDLSDEMSGKYVHTPHMTIPLAIYRKVDPRGFSNTQYGVLLYSCDSLEHLYRFAKPLHNDLKEWISETYRRPQSHLDGLSNFRPQLMYLDLKGFDEDVSGMGAYRGFSWHRHKRGFYDAALEDGFELMTELDIPMLMSFLPPKEQ